MGDVSTWISKYTEAMDKVNWDAASAEWNRMKSTFIGNYTSTSGLNPNIASKYRSKVEGATYRKPDVGKAKTNYSAKMRGG